MTNCGLHCLKINHITVKTGNSVILQDVNLHVHCGELTAIIGRNGAGKSTLLKAILGEIPHTGNVEFSGHDGHPTGNLQMGYVPQSLNIDSGSPATVFDMILSLTSNYPVFLPRRKKMAERIRRHLSEFNAASLLDKKLGQLSGGELQRVLLAAATLPKPDLLILDEPVSGVDQAGLQLFYSILEKLKATSDMVMLLVSHDLDYVKAYADRVVLLDGGVKAVGTADEVFACEPFKRAFPSLIPVAAKGEKSSD